MISREEIEAAATRYGAPESQIVRDHLISHVLAALAGSHGVVFFGGTALCRTWLPGLRLSEDIDLLIASFADADTIRESVSKSLRREFPDLVWTAADSPDDVQTWSLATTAIEVKVEFVLWRHGWQDAVPHGSHAVQLRYSDVPATIDMAVPTGTGFAAMKIIAWMDRAAPRDLYDLAALAEAGHLDQEALAVVSRVSGHAPTATSIGNIAMSKVESAWLDELGHQGNLMRGPSECLKIVRAALSSPSS